MAYPQDDALGITGDNLDFDVKRVLIDNGSATDVLTWGVLLGLKVPLEKLKPVSTPLQGFRGATMIFEETIDLPVTLGTYLPFHVTTLLGSPTRIKTDKTKKEEFHPRKTEYDKARSI
ncbi:Uncharacterized protein Adt_11623 [Abeliophyllum distichum]|uniref:Peptidase A2 domain-containing protein n=1 Tax=Abeliophyllum distichum TaxID=126358 RepID=A0ABD1UNE2_9LAMI